MKKSQQQTKIIERKHHVIDATNQSLGRLSTFIVRLLRGKNKANFVPNRDQGDYAVIENIDKIRLTGKKAYTKIYLHYSGYPGGIKEMRYSDLMSKNPKKILENSVFKMLPDNRLRKNIMKRLIIK